MSRPTEDPADTIAELRQQVETQRKVADAYREALQDEYRPHVEQNRLYALTIDALDEEVRTLKWLYAEATWRLERTDNYAQVLIDSHPDTGCQARIGTHLKSITGGSK